MAQPVTRTKPVPVSRVVFSAPERSLAATGVPWQLSSLALAFLVAALLVAGRVRRRAG